MSKLFFILKLFLIIMFLCINTSSALGIGNLAGTSDMSVYGMKNNKVIYDATFSDLQHAIENEEKKFLLSSTIIPINNSNCIYSHYSIYKKTSLSIRQDISKKALHKQFTNI